MCFVQDSCKNNVFLARFLQDICKNDALSCKILEAVLQECCKQSIVLLTRVMLKWYAKLARKNTM